MSVRGIEKAVKGESYLIWTSFEGQNRCADTILYVQGIEPGFSFSSVTVYQFSQHSIASIEENRSDR